MDENGTYSRFGCYRGKEAESYWPKASNTLKKAVMRSNGQLSLEQTRKLLSNDQAQLWFGEGPGWNMASVTMVIEYPGGRVVSILVLGGSNIVIWKDEFEAALHQFGKQNNCVALEACVRPGFVGATYNLKRGILKDCKHISTLIRKNIRQ